MMANFYKLILNGIYKLPAYAQMCGNMPLVRKLHYSSNFFHLVISVKKVETCGWYLKYPWDEKNIL